MTSHQNFVTVFLAMATFSLTVYFLSTSIFPYPSEVHTDTVSTLSRSPSSTTPVPKGRIKETVVIFIATNLTTPSLMLNDTYLGVCPQEIKKYCRLTNNKTELHQSDALIYHLPQNEPLNASYPVNAEQVRVMFAMEPPAHYVSNSRKFEPAIPIDLDQIWSSKNHKLTASWMVSNCNGLNKRNELVKAARKAGLAVNIFGGCGQKLPDCERDKFSKLYDCAAETLKNYKFYIAFENSNCKDYVSEKFFNSLRLYNAVPIVIRRKYYQDIGIPDDIYIALDDFHSISDMVTYINRLKDNKKRYLKYYNWRRRYQYTL